MFSITKIFPIKIIIKGIILKEPIYNIIVKNILVTKKINHLLGIKIISRGC